MISCKNTVTLLWVVHVADLLPIACLELRVAGPHSLCTNWVVHEGAHSTANSAHGRLHLQLVHLCKDYTIINCQAVSAYSVGQKAAAWTYARHQR